MIPTGSLGLDAIIGTGGIPKGMVTEIYGPESSSKTTLALCVISELQKSGGVAVLVDAEYAFNPSYAKQVGVDMLRLLVLQADTGEQALQCVESVVESGFADIVVLDSVAALVPEEELLEEVGVKKVALLARLMSQALRRMAGKVSKSGTAVVFINQIRMLIGMMYGNPEFSPGGRALKFYAALRLETRRIAKIGQKGEDPIGDRIRVKVTKNKLAPPFRSAELDVIYGRGIAPEYELLQLGERFGIIQRSGSLRSFGGIALGRGFDASCAFLRENASVFKDIRNEVVTKLWQKES